MKSMRERKKKAEARKEVEKKATNGYELVKEKSN